MEEILIIHNSLYEGAASGDKPAFAESNAGLIEEIKAVTGAFDRLGIKYEVKSIETIEQLPDVISHSNQAIIFNLVEELAGGFLDACYVPAVCRAYGRVCTGSDTPALLLAQNKWQTKAVLSAAGVPSPESIVVPIGQKKRQKCLSPGKYVVKSVFSDGSEGIDADSVVEIPGTAFHKALRRVHKQYKQPAIVEQFIPDRELNVSLLEQNGEVRVLPIAEFDFSAFDADKPRILDYAAKWLGDSFAYNNTPRIIPAPISEETAELVRKYALRAWDAIGCQDYARVDFRLDDTERPFVLEVNPNPDLSPEAGFAAALEAECMTFENFIEILFNNALMRNCGKTVF